MITIYDIRGTEILSIPVTSNCQRVERLMDADYVQLSWSAVTGASIPQGAYVLYEGEKYTLVDTYHPQQKTEREWLYQPQFQSYIMGWKKIPFFMYTTNASGEIVGKEIDWTLTASASMFLERVALALKEETGRVFSISTDVEGTASQSFNSLDIFSALNGIASAFDTEWWVEGDTLHLSTCVHGEAMELEVGRNINVPTISNDEEGEYNRFYVFGSTRNIVQSYNGANVNNIANKRLTLDPKKYPLGYYEPNGPQANVYSKILTFDGIYPSATSLTANQLLAFPCYVKGDNGKIQIGTDSEGKPIYDMYTRWFFKPMIGGHEFEFHNWNYSEDPNVSRGTEGMLIAGLEVSVSFTSGSLRGREFTVKYYPQETRITSDELSYVIPAGFFEINYVKEGDYIIPDAVSLAPSDGDSITLFNIKMPEAYTQDAYDRLEEAMLDVITKKYTEDNHQYSFSTNPVVFDGPITVGTRVRFKNGDYALETRVTEVTTKLDCPTKKNVVIGNAIIKGTIAELKEEAASANKNIEIIQALNNTTSNLANSYQRAQQALIDAMERWGKMFSLEEYIENGVTKHRIKAHYDGLYSDGFVSAGGVSTTGGESGGGVDTFDTTNPEYAYLDAVGNSARLAKHEAVKNLENRVEELEQKDSDKHYTYNQGTPSDSWEIAHNLNKMPSVTLVVNGRQCFGDVEFIDMNKVIVHLGMAVSGMAYLN